MSAETTFSGFFERSGDFPSSGILSEGQQIAEFDRMLRPVRRVLAFAFRDVVAHVPQIRHLEANAGRGLNQLRNMELPEVATEHLQSILVSLNGYDLDAIEGRVERLRRIHQELVRIDALFGFPLEVRVRVPVIEKPRQDLEEYLSYGGKPSGAVEVAEPELEEDADESAERKFRLGDPAASGRPVTVLGVGTEDALALAEEGIETVADLLMLSPISEDVLRPVYGAGWQIPVGRAAVSGRAHARVTIFGPGGRRAQMRLRGAADLLVEWTGPDARLIQMVESGEKVVFVGDIVSKPAVSDGEEPTHVLVNAEIAASTGQAVHLQNFGLEGLSDLSVREWIRRALPELDRLRDTMSADELRTLGLPSVGDAMRDALLFGSARPEARRRLAYDEALLLQIGLASSRFQAGRDRGVTHTILHGLLNRATSFMGVSLDDSQQAALEEIKRDLRHGLPMLRLVTGQAGTGKTTVAILTAIAVADSKSQVVFLAPDAATAELRFMFIEPVLREVGLVARLLVGEPTRAQRDTLRRGEVHVVISTHDLLDADVEYRRLGLVIAEERETYGRVAMKIASMRAPRPDLLVLAPTPVPTAVLLSAYAELDVSVVEKSATWGLQTSILPESRRAEAYRRVAEQLQTGRQAWVVFPQAPTRAGTPDAGTDVFDLRAARAVAHTLETEMFPGRSVGVFHGGTSREDRAKAYDDLRHRRYDILLATQPIEDGPTLSSAAVMVVEQADRMSLNRLQRLRGHVANLGVEGECIFLTGNEPDPEGLARLELLMQETDDWKVAEWDAQTRGIESLLAREVQGGARLRWLDPVKDRDLLVWGRERAHAILEEDPMLRRGSHGDIARALRDRWDDLMTAPCPLPDPTGGVAQRKRRRRRKRK